MYYLIALSLFFTMIPGVRAFELKAPQAYMVDLQTGAVLFEKNADQPMVPSSLSKIMTAHIIFERLKNGDIKLTDTLPVSTKAWKTEGSRMFVTVDSEVNVEDLLKGVIVQSGNDACVVLAEGLAGSEEAFSEEMTRKAHELGAKKSTFLNTTGLPQEGHLSTAKDLALIAERTIKDFPEYYQKYYGLKDFTYNKITQPNRNTLITKNMGVDGLKTGHTDAGGYGIVVSAKQGDRRIIMVLNGLPSAKDRHEEAVRFVNWGFSYFKNYKVAQKGVPLDVVDVWGGQEKTVPVVAGKDVVITLPRHQLRNLQVKLIYNTPLPAPLQEGDQVGSIEITAPERGVQQIPLLAGKSVEKAWFHQRLKNSIFYLLLGKQ